MSEYDDDGSGGLGAYIRAQRQLAHMSLRQLSDVAQVSNAYLSQLERGLHQPSLRILWSIAEALSIPGEDLLAQAGMSNGHSAHSAGERTGRARTRRPLSSPTLSVRGRQAPACAAVPDAAVQA